MGGCGLNQKKRSLGVALFLICLTFQPLVESVQNGNQVSETENDIRSGNSLQDQNDLDQPIWRDNEMFSDYEQADSPPGTFFTTILKQNFPALPITKSIDIYIDNTIKEVNITITANVTAGSPNTELTRPSGNVVPPIPGKMGPVTIVDKLGVRRITIQNPEGGSWNLKKNEPTKWHVEITAFSTINFSTKFEQTINGVKQEIQGRPNTGEKVTITVTVPQIATIKSIDRVILTDHEGKFLNAVNLKTGSSPAEFTGDIQFPKKPFQLTIGGKDTDDNLIQRLDTTKTISPVAVTLKVENITKIYMDETKKITFTVRNDGDRSTVVTVDIQEDKGFLQNYPEKNFTIPVGGNVTGSFTLHAGKTIGEKSTVILTEHALDVSGAKPHNETLVLTVERPPDNTPPECNVTSVTGSCSVAQMDPCECHKHKWSAIVEFGDDGYGLSKITSDIKSPGLFKPDAFNQGDTIGNGVKTAKISGDCCEPLAKMTVEDMANNTGQCKADLTNGAAKPTYPCTTTTQALTTLPVTTKPPAVFSSSDKTAPTCTVIQTSGQCTESQMDVGQCGDSVWYGTVQFQDENSGLYTVQTTVHEAQSLIHDPFDQGDKSLKKAKLVGTCCNALSYIMVVDMAGNTASCELDVRIPPEDETQLSTGGIAAVSVGVSAAFIGAIVAAVLITKKCNSSPVHPETNTGRFRSTAWE